MATQFRWPSNLPQVLPVGTTIADEPNYVATEMDGGPEKRRQRATTIRRFIEIDPSRWIFTQDQVDTLLDFHRTVLEGGTGSFMWRDAIPFLGDVEMRFRGDPPKAIALGGTGPRAKYRVEMALQVDP